MVYMRKEKEKGKRNHEEKGTRVAAGGKRKRHAGMRKSRRQEAGGMRTVQV